MKNVARIILILVCLVLSSSTTFADGLSNRALAKVDYWIAQAKQWAMDPSVIKAVSAQNAQPAPELLAMTNEKWASLPETDPFVYAFTQNAAGRFLRSKKGEAVSEAFISDARGNKVAFLSKTTFWSHQGKPKHEVPMTGEVWKGKPEVDKSSGTLQMQMSVPIIANDKPIGSLVIGIAVSHLASDAASL